MKSNRCWNRWRDSRKRPKPNLGKVLPQRQSGALTKELVSSIAKAENKKGLKKGFLLPRHQPKAQTSAKPKAVHCSLPVSLESGTASATTTEQKDKQPVCVSDTVRERDTRTEEIIEDTGTEKVGISASANV